MSFCSGIKPLAIVGLSLLITACMPTTNTRAVNSLAELGPDEVLIVGKVELDPPLGQDEQDLGESYEKYRNQILLVTDDQLRDASQLTYGDLSSRIEAPFGKTFFISHKNEPFYILKGWVVMRAKVEVITPGESYVGGNAPLFGAFRVDIRPEDSALYIGTIRYHRDEFFGTEKVVIYDDFAKAQAEVRQQFGDTVRLRKALVQPVMD